MSTSAGRGKRDGSSRSRISNDSLPVGGKCLAAVKRVHEGGGCGIIDDHPREAPNEFALGVLDYSVGAKVEPGILIIEAP